MSAPSNWNLVCHGGLAIGALAVAEEEPELAKTILDTATANLPLPFGSFQPDGAWEAGPDYWAYTCRYATFAIEAFTTALGQDFNLPQAPGFSQTGLFLVHCTAPSGESFNFADAKSETRSIPALFWLGKRFNLPACLNENHRRLQQQVARGVAPDAFDLIWYQPPAPAAALLPLAAHFRRVEAAMMRSSWTDKDAMFVGFKAGFNQANHGHLDLGSFVLEAASVRWSLDLGLDDYDLPGYFDRTEGGARWKHFRLGSHSHNTLIFNGDQQRFEAKAPITTFNSTGKSGVAIADLTAAAQPHVNSWRRGVKMVEGKALVIQDEITWAGEARQACWQMLTDAEIQLAGAEARLTKNGRTLIAKILSPAGTQFSQKSAEQPAPQQVNPGCKQLLVALEKCQPSTTLCVVLSVEAIETKVTGLDTWSRP